MFPFLASFHPDSGIYSELIKGINAAHESLKDYKIKCDLRFLDKREHSIDECIERNFTGQITLEGVARYVYVNPAYLSSIFKKHTGENFMSYLTARRIRYAKELLENPKYKIYEIGRMVGYLDPGYFSIIFKKNEGITPYEYRSKML